MTEFYVFQFYNYVITTESGQVTVWCKQCEIFLIFYKCDAVQNEIIWPYNSWVEHLVFSQYYLLKSYWALSECKMAAAAILDLVTFSHSMWMLNCAQLNLFWCQVWWKSVQLFQSYSAPSKFKMAVAAILDFITTSNMTRPARWALPDLLGVQIW